MAYFWLEVPGHAVVPTQGGPDVFDNVSGLNWTDQQGWRLPTETLFSGKANQTAVDFHFPFTTPLIFGVTPQQSAYLSVRGVAVYFRMLNPVVRVDRIRVSRGQSIMIDTGGIGALNLNHSTSFANSLVLNQNFFTLPSPGSPAFNRLGVTITVNFGQTGGIMRFLGAALQLQN
jgi:hypothetical protein